MVNKVFWNILKHEKLLCKAHPNTKLEKLYNNTNFQKRFEYGTGFKYVQTPENQSNIGSDGLPVWRYTK